MAKTLNYPLTKTVLSAEGSAEVLGRGTNEYTDLWSADTDTDWSLWDTFPTVVRFGNYVYCWSGTTSLHSYYILIDVVEDPESDTELGSNLAFRELSNDTSNTVSNVLISKEVITASLTDGSYTSLPITSGYDANTLLSPGARFESTARSFVKFTPVFTSGTISDILISCNTAVVANSPRLRGWGDYSTMKGTNGDVRYGLFAPFATKEQFEFIYGKEHNWSNPNAASDDWLFEVESGSASTTVTYSGDLSYPFTVTAMVPNTLYRDVPGDTTGDGIDNTPSLEDALAVYAIATALVPSLDPTKCPGFPGDLLSVVGIDISAIKKKIDDVKASIDSALSSAALSELGKKLKGLKADLLGLLPKIPTIHNIVLEIMGMDPTDLEAIENLNKKWKGVVGDVTGFFEDLTKFDICSLIGLDAKDGEDGEIVKKPDPAVTPDKPIEESPSDIFPPIVSKDFPHHSTTATPSDALAARGVYNAAWKELRKKSPGFSTYLSERETLQFKFDAWNTSPSHQVLRGALNSKNDGNNYSGLNLNILGKKVMKNEEPLLDKLYIATWISNALAAAQKQITEKLQRAEHGITSDTDPSTLWTAPEIIRDGKIYTELSGLVATMDKETRATILGIEDQINIAIKKHILNSEILKASFVMFGGAPGDYSPALTVSVEAREFQAKGVSKGPAAEPLKPLEPLKRLGPLQPLGPKPVEDDGFLYDAAGELILDAEGWPMFKPVGSTTPTENVGDFIADEGGLIPLDEFGAPIDAVGAGTSMLPNQTISPVPE